MPAGPVGKDHDARADVAQDLDNPEPILPGVLYATVGDVERLTPAGTEDAGRIGGFGCPLFGRPTRSGLATSQIQDGCRDAAGPHAQQRATAGLFYVVAMGRNGENLGNRLLRHAVFLMRLVDCVV